MMKIAILATVLVVSVMGDTCPDNSYCCPDALHCLTPTKTSCVSNSTACSSDETCCPVTKICVSVGAACTPSPVCKSDQYCSPVFGVCVSLPRPGVFCEGFTCKAPGKVSLCSPLTHLCIDANFTAPCQ